MRLDFFVSAAAVLSCLVQATSSPKPVAEIIAGLPSCALPPPQILYAWRMLVAAFKPPAYSHKRSTACSVPVRDKAARYNIIAILLGVITILITATRLIFKQFFSHAKALDPDDWAILGTVAIYICGMFIGIEGLTAYGLGKDIWTLTTSEIPKFALYFYVMEILYLSGISLIKLSLSLFYLKIFSGLTIRRLLWGTVILNISYGFVFIVTAIFQCSPYLDGLRGHCVNTNLFGWLYAAISVAVDFWMIALPLSQVINLWLHWKKKIGVAIMFLLGTFIRSLTSANMECFSVTVVSILRLHSLIYFANSSNLTWDQWTTAYWLVIEINVGMICTCLPSLRLIFVRLFPRKTGTSNSAYYQHDVVSGTRNTHRGKIVHTEEVM
ncbi:hypothetical protein TOPH_06097 [Tolypocladium ophioglossoides CBS 100239]|uniref:Rhodopsin domain-containing protein n=1 Tax=Tolypocladium ophioglossoides (strain CBS 100239) TaxID=1163406 RepID=A0A0L0N5D0_TOLOC|nr:hypothetical protein TOPH_06097 [Tolypocladium ophioglossoides CBS 100239]